MMRRTKQYSWGPLVFVTSFGATGINLVDVIWVDDMDFVRVDSHNGAYGTALEQSRLRHCVQDLPYSACKSLIFHMYLPRCQIS